MNRRRFLTTIFGAAAAVAAAPVLKLIPAAAFAHGGPAPLPCEVIPVLMGGGHDYYVNHWLTAPASWIDIPMPASLHGYVPNCEYEGV